MKGIFTRFNLIVGLAALVLLSLCFVQQAVRAHEPKLESTIARATTTGANPPLLSDHRDGPLFPDLGTTIGMATGQTLSVKMTNLIEVKGGKDPVIIFARMRLFDPQGRQIAQSAEVRIPFKKAHSFTFRRDALRPPGEPGTGRLTMQLNGWVRYVYPSGHRGSAEPFPHIRDARASGLLPVSVHLTDESNGRTTTLYEDVQKKSKYAVDGSQLPSKERQAGLKEMQAEREKEKSQGNQAVTGRVTGIAIDPGNSTQPAAPVQGGFGNDRMGTIGYGNNSTSGKPTNQRPRVAQPDLVIKQFLFPPTNDKALRVQVVNQGNAASGACRLILMVRKINGTAVGRQTHVNIPALAPGKTVWLVIDAKSILPNNVSLQSTTFKLNVDATEIVAESDEGNNEVWHNL